jgi:hypothetical protein
MGIVERFETRVLVAGMQDLGRVLGPEGVRVIKHLEESASEDRGVIGDGSWRCAGWLRRCDGGIHKKWAELLGQRAESPLRRRP